MRWIAPLVVLLLFLAGCTRPPAATPDPSTGMEAGPTTDPGPAEGPQRRSLAKVPEWQIGEWWTYEVFDYYFQQTYRATRVVAQREGTNWLVGMPTHDWSNEVMIFHVPGMGEVSAEDLSFEVHDNRFHPVKFPLAVGKTWETEFETRPMKAEVTKIEGDRARIYFQGTAAGSNERFNVTYDAQVGEVVLFEHPTYVRYRVLDHGFQFAQMVTVPHGHDLVFQQARFGPLKDTSPPDVGQGPMEELEVSSTYDRVSFVLVAGSPIKPPPPVPAGTEVPQTYYRETVTAPNGTVYEIVVSSEETQGTFKASFHRHERPGGLWKFEHVAGGPGLVMTEGIGYHVYDIQLPEGHILPSSGEHKHGHEGHHD